MSLAHRALRTLLRTRSALCQTRRNLPLCTVETNVKRADLPADVDRRISKCVADVLGKDEKVVHVTVRTDVPSCRAGSNEPTAVVSIWSIGVFDAQKNPTYVQPLYDTLVKALNLPADRIGLFFLPINKEAAGHLLYQEQTANK